MIERQSPMIRPPGGRRLSRRALLRGLGTAVALPLLDAMCPATRLLARASVVGGPAGADRPRRMAFIFVPNGAHMPDWTPQAEGRHFDLPYILEPLEAVRHQTIVLSGLTHDKGRANGDGAGDHARSASVFLTGCQPVKTQGANIRVGVSADQIAAHEVGSATRFPSLEIGCDGGRNTGNCDSGYSCAYSHNISWAGPATPMAKEIDPRRLFDRLFAGGDPAENLVTRARRRARRLSILDFVLQDARKLQSDLGGSDRQKLDEYLTAVRELERRLAAAGGPPTLQEVEAPEGLPSEPGRRLEYEEHMRLLLDVLVLAWRCDLTRIATFMFAHAGSNRNYRQIGIPNGHHELSHHQGRPEKHEKIRRINRFHVTQLAYFLERLESVKEGDRSLLDSAMVLYGSGISDGNRHNNDNLPLVLAGGGGGTIDAGRHIRYAIETPVTNLFLSMLDRMGVEVSSLGDSSGRLEELL